MPLPVVQAAARPPRNLGGEEVPDAGVVPDGVASRPLVGEHGVRLAHLDRLGQKEYDADLAADIAAAQPVGAGGLERALSGLQSGRGRPVAIFLDTESEVRRPWLWLAAKLGVWDLDVRGAHQGCWRLGRAIVVGTAGPFGASMPAGVVPNSPPLKFK